MRCIEINESATSTVKVIRLTLTWDVLKSEEDTSFSATATGLTLTWDVLK